MLILASTNIITCLFSSQTLTSREGSGIIASIYTIWEPSVSVSGSALPHLTPHTHGTPDTNTDAGSCHVLNIAAYLTIVMDKLERAGGFMEGLLNTLVGSMEISEAQHRCSDVGYSNCLLIHLQPPQAKSELLVC